MYVTIPRNLWKFLNRRCCTSTKTFIRKCSAATETNRNEESQSRKLFHFQNVWPSQEKEIFERDMIIVENFITETEEQSLVAEAEKSMKRMRYEYDHWDNAIHGYREREKEDWNPDNRIIFDRIRQLAFESNTLPAVHILDLAKDGIIKPHVDSSRYCGNTIAGLSLLTDCIMRLKRIDEKQYVQSKAGEDATCPANKSAEASPAIVYEHFVDALLKRRSLYIMKHTARYNFTHEVLATNATFMDTPIEKGRRISIISRNQA